MALFHKEQVQAASSGGLETVLGSSTSFQGIIKSDGNIRIDGTLQGRVETAGNLVIGPTARVVADIRANAVQVWGHIQGNIQAAGRLEILSSGRVFGEVTVGSLMIDEGGLFRGQCYMDGKDVDQLPLDLEPLLLGTGQDIEQAPRAEVEEPVEADAETVKAESADPSEGEPADDNAEGESQ